MADSAVAVTPGSGANVDTRTQTGGDHRQVVVVGDETAATCAPVDAGGVHTRPGKTTTAATTRVAGAVTSTQLLAANAARITASFYNDSSADLYLKYGTAASATSKKLRIPPAGYWEMPAGNVYTGVVHGLWTAATGAVDIVEETV